MTETPDDLPEPDPADVPPESGEEDIDHGEEANRIPDDADESQVPDAELADDELQDAPDPAFGETDDESDEEPVEGEPDADPDDDDDDADPDDDDDQ